MSWTDLSADLKRDVAEKLDFMGRRSMKQTSRLNREIVNSTRVFVPRVKILVDDSDYTIIIYTGIEKFLKIEIKKGYDQKTVVYRSENNCEAVESKPTGKNSLDVFVEILASLFHEKEAVDIGVLEWDFKMNAVVGSENEKKLQKRQGIFLNVLLLKIEKSTESSNIFSAQKLVVTGKCSADFIKGLPKIVKEDSFENIEYLLLKNFERGHKSGPWCSVYAQTSEPCYTHMVFYAEVESIDQVLLSVNSRSAYFMTIRFAVINERARKIWSRAGSVVARSSNNKEFKIVRAKKEQQILLHVKSDCGYSITGYTEKKFAEMGGMKWFETDFMNRKCDLGWFCKKCCDPFDYWYHQNLRTLNSEVQEMNSDDTFVKSWGFKESEDVRNEMLDPKTERDQLIAQYEQLIPEITELAKLLARKMSGMVKKWEGVPRTGELKSALEKCESLAKTGIELPENLKDLVKAFKTTEEVGVEIMREHIGVIQQMKIDMLEHIEAFDAQDDSGVKNSKTERAQLIAQFENLLPKFKELAATYTKMMPEAMKRMKKGPATEGYEELAAACDGLPSILMKWLTRCKSSNGTGIEEIREKLEMIQRAIDELELNIHDFGKLIDKKHEMNSKTERAQLIAQCEQLFPEVSQLSVTVLSKWSEVSKKLEGVPITDDVKTAMKDWKEVAEAFCEVPELTDSLLKQFKNSDEIGVGEMREKLESIKQMKIHLENGMERANEMLRDVEKSQNSSDVKNAPNGKKRKKSKNQRAQLIAQCENLLPKLKELIPTFQKIMPEAIQIMGLGPLMIEFLQQVKTCGDIPRTLEMWLTFCKSSNEIGIGEIRKKLAFTQRTIAELEEPIQVFGELINQKQSAPRNERDELIAECEQLFPEVAKLSTTFSSRLSKEIPTLKRLPQAEFINNILSTCEQLEKVGKELPDLMNMWLMGFKNSDEIGIEVIREKLGTVRGMKTQFEKGMQHFEGSVNSKKPPQSERNGMIIRCEQLILAFRQSAIKFSTMLSELIKPLEYFPLDEEFITKLNGFVEDAKKFGKTVPLLESLLKGYKRDSNNKNDGAEIQNFILAILEMQMEVETKLKLLEELKRDSEDVENSDALNNALNLNDERAQLISQCEKLFPEVCQLSITILRKSIKLKKVLDDPTMEAPEDEIETYKKMIEVCDGLPEMLTAWLNSFKISNHIGVKLIRERIVLVQNARIDLEMYATMFESLKELEDSGDSEVSEIKNMNVTENSDDVTKVPDEKSDSESEKSASESDVSEIIGKKIASPMDFATQKSNVAESSDDVTKSPVDTKDSESTQKCPAPESDVTKNVEENMTAQAIFETQNSDSEIAKTPDDVTKAPDGKKDSESAQKSSASESDVSKEIGEEVATSPDSATQKSNFAENSDDVTKSSDEKNDSESAQKSSAPKSDVSKEIDENVATSPDSATQKSNVTENSDDAKAPDDKKNSESGQKSPAPESNATKNVKENEADQAISETLKSNSENAKTPDHKKDSEDVKDSDKKNSMKPETERAQLIAECEKSLPEFAQLASKFKRMLSELLEKLKVIPETDNVKILTKDCKELRESIDGVPEQMISLLEKIIRFDEIGVEEIREKMVMVLSARNHVEEKMKLFERFGISGGVEIPNPERDHLIAQCDQLFSEVSELTTTLSKTKKMSGSCDELPKMLSVWLIQMKTLKEFSMEMIRERLESAQKAKINLENCAKFLKDNETQNSNITKASDEVTSAPDDKNNSEDVEKDSKNHTDERFVLVSQCEQLFPEVSQMATVVLRKVLIVIKQIEEKPATDERQIALKNCHSMVKECEETIKTTIPALTHLQNSPGIKMEVIREKIAMLQKAKSELEQRIKFFENVKDSEEDSGDVEISDNEKIELIAQCEQLITDSSKMALNFSKKLSETAEKCKLVSKPQDFKDFREECEKVAKDYKKYSEVFDEALVEYKNTDKGSLEEIRQQISIMQGHKSDLERGFQKISDKLDWEKDSDDVEDSGDVKTVSDNVREAPDDKKDSDDVPKAPESASESDVYQKIGKKMFGSIPEANALVDPRSRKARSINPDDYDYVGSLHPEEFTEFIERRRKLDSSEFDFNCDFARLQFLAAFILVFFSILFVVLWMETLVY